MFGRRWKLLFWDVWIVLLLIVILVDLPARWALFAGLWLGAAGMASQFLPDTMMPGRIFKWQLGAWGEEVTARELHE